MRASVLIIIIMIVVAWMLAIPLLILIALDAIMPGTIAVNQWSYLGMLFILLIVGGMMRQGGK
jgi:hypothetical protein